MFIKDYMTPNPVTVSPKTKVRDTFFLIKKYGFHQLPVVEDGKTVGIITDRDLRTALFRPDLTVEEIMTPDPITIGEGEPVESAILILRENRFNALPVVSEKGELVGIITLRDILDAIVGLIGIVRGDMGVISKVPKLIK